MGLRPEHFAPLGNPQGPEVRLQADVVENLGAVSYVHAFAGGDEPIVVEVKEGAALQRGAAFSCQILAERAFLFDAAGERL